MQDYQDYEQLIGTLNLRLQFDSFMLAFFVDMQWFPENARQLIMDSSRETCARIFRKLTTDATARRASYRASR
ncbi:MAG: hypothetical protein MUO63_14520 [Desulfobulbaceae bacterium]|nr:hypothetical protein [Desulfobulbaceae bacterium]